MYLWRQWLGEDCSDYLNCISTEMVAYLSPENTNRPSHLKHTVVPFRFIDNLAHLPRPSSTLSRHGIVLKILSFHMIHPCTVVLLLESQSSVCLAPSPPDDLFVTSLVYAVSAPLIILVIFHAPFSATSSTRK